MNRLSKQFKFGIVFWAVLFVSIPLSAQQKELSEKLQHVTEGKRAQIGIAVIIDGKDTVTLNNSTHYPMLSVFKFHQALAVMNYQDTRNLSGTTELHVKAAELDPETYSPMREEYPKQDFDISIFELLRYTLQKSDNNACDLLFRYTGGPEATDRYIRSLGIQDFAISATEGDMHADLGKCYDNWTTPLAAVELLEVFLNKSLPSNDLQRFISAQMIGCETGKDRLPKPLQGKNALIGHKTGSSDRTPEGISIGTNDIGFVCLPNKHHYTIAVFIKDSQESDAVNAEIIATISEVVYNYVEKL